MSISEEQLLASGFTPADMKKIKNNLASYGGTLGEAIHDLANRFRVILWIFYGCLALIAWLIISGDIDNIISGSIGLAVTMFIVVFINPPVLSYKSWVFWKKKRC
ncbi:hypothetical protein J4G53_25525 [Serratia ureilytica]|uniref:hypothetical protein n=1 Tax=Serratia ureilytica TaxID=300181 RepID=UPI001AA154AE|nr:hypothetical protein [Serratia ureilytica]MBO1811589.1 hypothetical protein [Serratia ureilytica]